MLETVYMPSSALLERPQALFLHSLFFCVLPCKMRHKCHRAVYARSSLCHRATHTATACRLPVMCSAASQEQPRCSSTLEPLLQHSTRCHATFCDLKTIVAGCCRHEPFEWATWPVSSLRHHH